MEKRNIDKTLTRDQISYLHSLGVECDLQDLLMRFPVRSSDKLTINRGVNLL